MDGVNVLENVECVFFKTGAVLEVGKKFRNVRVKKNFIINNFACVKNELCVGFVYDGEQSTHYRTEYEFIDLIRSGEVVSNVETRNYSQTIKL